MKDYFQVFLEPVQPAFATFQILFKVFLERLIHPPLKALDEVKITTTCAHQ